MVRPEPLETSTQKFALNVRQFYLNLMHDVCIQIYTNGDDAAQRASSEELSCHERCKALNVYKNSCMLAIHRLKKELEQEKTGDISVAPVSRFESHEAILAGKCKGSWSVMKPRRSVPDFKGPLFYQKLSKWILTDQQLKDNGYPRPHPDGQNVRSNSPKEQFLFVFYFCFDCTYFCLKLISVLFLGPCESLCDRQS